MPPKTMPLSVQHCRSERLNLDRWEGMIIVVSLTTTLANSHRMKTKETAKKYALVQLPDGKECKSKASSIAVGWSDSTPGAGGKDGFGYFCSLDTHLDKNMKMITYGYTISRGISTTPVLRVCTCKVIKK